MILGGIFIANALIAEVIGVKYFHWKTALNKTCQYKPVRFAVQLSPYGRRAALACCIYYDRHQTVLWSTWC